MRINIESRQIEMRTGMKERQTNGEELNDDKKKIAIQSNFKTYVSAFE